MSDFSVSDLTKLVPQHSLLRMFANLVALLILRKLMYLTFPEKQQVFANVREILQTYGGVWITSDLTTKEAGQTLQTDSALQQVYQKISSSTGQRLADNNFDDLDHVKQFTQEQGFQVETFSMLEVVDQLESVFALKINLDHVRKLLEATPIFALTLAF